MRTSQRNIGPVTRSDGAWIAVFLTIAAAWLGLAWLSIDPRLPPAPASQSLGWFDGTLDGALWRSLCSATMASAGWPLVTGMWLLMVFAMMLPAALPTIAAFIELTERRPGGALGNGVALFVLGYLLVWSSFALAAAGLQWQLAGLGLVAADGLSQSWLLTALLLALAGLYQFTTLKAACLSQCHAPMTFFIAHWREGRFGALVMGLRHGITCVGCCWALMLLAFVGGMMNLAFMSLAMMLMLLEKLPAAGRLISKPLGATLVAGAALVTATNLGWQIWP